MHRQDLFWQVRQDWFVLRLYKLTVVLPVASICSIAPEVVPVIQKPFSPTLLCEKRALVHSTRPLLKTSKVASLTSSVYAHDEILYPSFSLHGIPSAVVEYKSGVTLIPSP